MQSSSPFSSPIGDNIPAAGYQSGEARGPREPDPHYSHVTDSVLERERPLLVASSPVVRSGKRECHRKMLHACWQQCLVVFVHVHGVKNARSSFVMGRLNKTAAGSGSNVTVHYRKLVEDYNAAPENFKLMPSLPEYLSYCCRHCGHTQKLKVKLNARTQNDGTEKASCRNTGTGWFLIRDSRMFGLLSGYDPVLHEFVVFGSSFSAK